MTSNRSVKGFATVAAAVLLLGAFVAAPADAKKKKKPKKCPAYAAPEWAGEAETTTVTPKATEEKPIELTVETAPGLGFSGSEPGGSGEAQNGAPSSVYHNFVIDSASPTASVWARIEFFELEDYDLWWRNPDGSPSASAAGYGPVPGGEGGETGFGFEQVNEVASLDCQGFTAEIVSAITPGGEITMTVWLTP